MDNDNSDDEFMNIARKDLAKISEKMENMGYKDGIHNGRESQFQNGFDDGYQHGFENGFLLGKYEGIISTTKSIACHPETLNIERNALMQRPFRGQCILCSNQGLQENSIKDIVARQSEHMKNVRTTLQTQYGPLK